MFDNHYETHKYDNPIEKYKREKYLRKKIRKSLITNINPFNREKAEFLIKRL